MKLALSTIMLRRMVMAVSMVQLSMSIQTTKACSQSITKNIAEKKFDEAIALARATRCNQDDLRNARLELIKALEEAARYRDAIDICTIMLDYSPSDTQVCNKIAALYNQASLFDEASMAYRKSLLLDPKNPQIMLEFGNLLNMTNQPEVAYEMYDAIVDLGINNNSVEYNKAYSIKKMERYDEAARRCRAVIAKNPEYPQAHFALACIYLIQGNYADGWKEYEWRWQQASIPERKFDAPLWDGSPLNGNILYLHAEQGLGDTLQFIRYAIIAKERGAHVIAAVQKPLIKLLQRCPYIDRVVQIGFQPSIMAAHAPLLTLPRILNTEEASIPNYFPYLFADPELTTEWANTLAADTHIKIGLCWQGNPNYSTHFLRTAVAQKSVRPALFEPLSRIPNISFYSLQKDHATNMDEQLPEGFIIKSLGDDFDVSHGAFMDTAAVMRNLDLVITVDTSIAHLAGGLGVPVWVLLPKPADWRWLLHRHDTPWYPTMRLFRQHYMGHWEDVIQDMYKALQEFVGTLRITHEPS